MSAAKGALRQKMKALRSGIADRIEKDCKITQKMLELIHCIPASEVFCYVSMADEADTHALIGALYGKIALYVPYTEGDGMIPVLYEGQALAPDRRGNIAGLDAIKTIENPFVTIVPLLAFTPAGSRLGYGSGCYDRFLASAQTMSVGIAYDEQLLGAFPIETHDKPLDGIMTPDHFYKSPGFLGKINDMSDKE